MLGCNVSGAQSGESAQQVHTFAIVHRNSGAPGESLVLQPCRSTCGSTRAERSGASEKGRFEVCKIEEIVAAVAWRTVGHDFC